MNPAVTVRVIGVGRRFDAVLRAEGGDPSVFGRDIEDERACDTAGVR